LRSDIFLTAISLATSYLNLSKASIASGTTFLLLDVVAIILIHLQVYKTYDLKNKTLRFSIYIMHQKYKNKTRKFCKKYIVKKTKKMI